MRQLISIFGLGVFVAVGSGCGEDAVPKADPPDELTIWSIDGTTYESGQGPKGDEYFRGWPVLGKLEVTDVGERAEVFGAFEAGLEDADSFPECFNPRHGISVLHGNRTTDYLICFECAQLKVFAGRDETTVGTTRDARAVLNRYLKAAAVPLSVGADPGGAGK